LRMNMDNKAIQEFFDELAPKWDSFENGNSMKIKTLMDKLEIKKGEKVADVACGTGVVTGLIHAYSNETVYGIDLSKKMIEEAKKKYEGRPWAVFRQGDFLLDEEYSAYDYVVIYNAYPHFLEPEKLSEALNRVLRKGGRFAIVHSLSREQLRKHHDSICPSISRDIASPLEESHYYQDHFSTVLASEDDSSYLLIMKKKD
jgi:ubiquinone/menaquinone biosynthesis C-methylase UbiE